MSFLLVDKNSTQLQIGLCCAPSILQSAPTFKRIIDEFQNQAARFVNGEAGCIRTKRQNLSACRTDNDKFSK